MGECILFMGEWPVHVIVIVMREWECIFKWGDGNMHQSTWGWQYATINCGMIRGKR